MTHILVRKTIEDYPTWKSTFDLFADVRKANGSQGGRIFCQANDPHEVYTIFEWDSQENALKFLQSVATRQNEQGIPIDGKPDFTFLKELDQFSA
jgi:hypothetical protein